MTHKAPPLDSSGVPTRIDQLRSLTDHELETAIRQSSHTVGGGDILDEATRRRAERQAAWLVKLTVAIAVLTGIVVVLTLVLLLRPE
jgi:hypothetical protein